MTLLLALALAPSAPARADARLLRVAGPVSIRAVGHQRYVPAQPDATLIAGDALRTGPGGVAQLELEDGGLLLVTENSSFALSGPPEDPLIEFKLGEWLLGFAKKLAPGQRLRVATPQAVAAVRGTLFWGKTDPRETLLAGLEREVEVQAAGKTETLRPGQLIRVPSGKAPEAPVAHEVPLKFLDRFKVGGSLAGVESLLSPAKRRAR